jgi:hypothetical protein
MTFAVVVRALTHVTARATTSALVILFHSLTAAGVSSGAKPSADHDWLHVVPDAMTPSILSSDALWPDEGEMATLHEKGFGTIDLLVGFELHISRNGTLTNRATFARHFLTDEGIRNLGNFGTSARSDVEDLFLERAYVHQSKDSIRELDLNRVQIVTGGAPDIFSDVFNVIVPFEGLTVGSTAVLKWRVVRRAHEWPLPWSEIFNLRSLSPIRRFEVQLTWDPGIEAPVWKTDADFLVCSANGERSVRCAARDVDPYEADEEIQYPIEAMPMLVVTERHEWKDLARAESRLVAESMRSADQLDALTTQILGNAKSTWDKLMRIHRFTSDEIRYVALEHGTAAVAPAPVAQTADRRYGDCKDKVALFLALAERAGLDAHPVLVATERSNPIKLITPSWQYFNHMIACVNVPGMEDPVCTDQTVPSAGTGSLPPSLYGAVALELREGTAAPVTIPTPEFVWNIGINSENILQCNGDVKEMLIRSFSGPSEVMIRALASALSADERRRWLIDDYKSVVTSKLDPEVSMSGVENVRVPLALKTTTEFLGSLSFEEMQEYVEYDVWLYHYGSSFATTNEKMPFQLKGVRINSNISFHVCPERDIGFLGPTLDFESEFGKLVRRYEREGAKVMVYTSLELPTQIIAVSQLERYKKFLERALRQTRMWFGIVERPGGARGAVR